MRAAVGRGGSCQVINISEAGEQKKRQADEWLDGQVARLYDDRDEVVVKNPTLRLMTLYDLLEGEAKSEFYGYVRAAAARLLGEGIMREQFWACMASVPSQWEDMEEYGKKLAARQKACRERK